MTKFVRWAFGAATALAVPALILGGSYWLLTRDAGAWLLIDNATRGDAEVFVDGASRGTVRARSFLYVRSSPGPHRLAARFASGEREEVSGVLSEPDSPIERVTGVYNLAGAGRYIVLEVNYGTPPEPSTSRLVGEGQRFFVVPALVDESFDVPPPPSMATRGTSVKVTRLCHATALGRPMCPR